MWFAALGISAGPLAFAAAAARGARLRLELHIFGKRVDLTRGRGDDRAEPDSQSGHESADEAEPVESQGTVRRTLATHFERVEGYGALLGRLERRVRLESLGLNLVYGFRDVALTGRLAGGIAALAGVLPARVQLTQMPLWSGPERWEITARGRLGIWLGLALKELLWYILGRRFGRSTARDSLHGQDQHLRNRE
jgi:hypothetical protein